MFYICVGLRVLRLLNIHNAFKRLLKRYKKIVKCLRHVNLSRAISALNVNQYVSCESMSFCYERLRYLFKYIFAFHQNFRLHFILL